MERLNNLVCNKLERLNNAAATATATQVCSLYGVKMGEYGDEGVSSMMALMTAQEAPEDGGRMIRSVPVHGSFSSFHGQAAQCLVSAGAIFQAHPLQGQPVREQLVSPEAVSSLPLVRTGRGFPYQFELYKELAENCFAESASMHLVSPEVTVLAARTRETPPEADCPHFSISTRTPANIYEHQEVDTMKAKILAHPQYPCLLEAYINCQKVGAPPEEVARLDAIAKQYENPRNRLTMRVGMDPELDRFMEAYCQILIKYQEELTKPFKEAMAFFEQVESQLNSLRISHSGDNDEKTEGVGSSDADEEGCSTGEMEYQEVDHHSEDRALKDHLFRKYGGCLSSLRKEFMKKKKKGKLPKNARQKLLDWWNVHYKWPYPSETEKVALAESTGLDQKQINNWFINQRKRHWKPSEDGQLMVMEALETHSPRSAALYMERHYMGEGSAFHLDC